MVSKSQKTASDFRQQEFDSLVCMGALSTARRTRLHRTNAAMYLASLNSSCSSDELSKINWDALLTVPHWCFSEKTQSNQLQLVCGTVFLAPAIVHWIDASRLIEVRTLVGPAYFDHAIRTGSGRVDCEPVNIETEVPELLATAGAAVMVGAIENTTVRTILAEQFPMVVENIEPDIARAVYELALTVIDVVHEAKVNHEPHENHEAQAGNPTSQEAS